MKENTVFQYESIRITEVAGYHAAELRIIDPKTDEVRWLPINALCNELKDRAIYVFITYILDNPLTNITQTNEEVSQ